MHKITQCASSNCRKVLPPRIRYCAYCGSEVQELRLPESTRDTTKIAIASSATRSSTAGAATTQEFVKRSPVKSPDPVWLLALPLIAILIGAPLMAWQMQSAAQLEANARATATQVAAQATLVVQQTRSAEADSTRVAQAIATNAAILSTATTQAKAYRTAIAEQAETATVLADLAAQLRSQQTATVAAQATEVAIAERAAATSTAVKRLSANSTSTALAEGQIILGPKSGNIEFFISSVPYLATVGDETHSFALRNFILNVTFVNVPGFSSGRGAYSIVFNPRFGHGLDDSDKISSALNIAVNRADPVCDACLHFTHFLPNGLQTDGYLGGHAKTGDEAMNTIRFEVRGARATVSLNGDNVGSYPWPIDTTNDMEFAVAADFIYTKDQYGVDGLPPI